MAVAASLTLLPAVLSLLGDRLNAGHIPLIQRSQARFDEQRPGGFWDRLATTVMNHAVLSVVLAGGLLIAAAIPYFRINTGFAGISTLPDSLPAKQAFTVLDRNFSGGVISPAQVVIDGDVNSPEVRAGVERRVAAGGRCGPSESRGMKPTMLETWRCLKCRSQATRTAIRRRRP
jgi:RND superfamily putative drug exporter